MASKAETAFPKECCGVCKYYEPRTKNEGLCFALPPQISSDGDGFTWLRGGEVEPRDITCTYFKPKCHA